MFVYIRLYCTFHSVFHQCHCCSNRIRFLCGTPDAEITTIANDVYVLMFDFRDVSTSYRLTRTLSRPHLSRLSLLLSSLQILQAARWTLNPDIIFIHRSIASPFLGGGQAAPHLSFPDNALRPLSGSYGLCIRSRDEIRRGVGADGGGE